MAFIMFYRDDITGILNQSEDSLDGDRCRDRDRDKFGLTMILKKFVIMEKAGPLQTHCRSQIEEIHSPDSSLSR